ncbi:hypothetical protein [Streptococcus marmotae]|uniref:hypothetical protein n=1 Tax=Streptococcus marmotae TaxID=1825069 RepID=UPI00082E6943|nr:hypothetical protein [Streptococcus marmotae]QBX16892.1 hypothetical protein Javan291_0016 [Streptococcus phage Javan291]
MFEKLKQFLGLSAQEEKEQLPDEAEKWRSLAIEYWQFAEKEKLGHRRARAKLYKLQAQVDYYKNLLEIHEVDYE